VPKPKRVVRSKNGSEVARARREEIIAAAVGVITSRGLHNLSLSKIESWAGMKRGQLTYYFPTKEEILLAVFDRLLHLLHEQLANGTNRKGLHPDVWQCVQGMLQAVLKPAPDLGREFQALMYTFLAQIAHREDFRQKLAEVFATWRDGIAGHLGESGKSRGRPTNHVAGQTVSAFVQALVHGLSVQLAADAKAFDRGEMLRLCVNVLAPLFTTPPPMGRKRKKAT
jgi:AcrR family transcriptional regulator